jgi:hypothetical protein
MRAKRHLRLLAGLPALVLAACAHAPPQQTDVTRELLTPTPVAAVAEGGAVRAPVDVEAILAGSGLSYVTLEPGRLWMLGFAGKDEARVTVHVVRGDQFTMILGRICMVPAGAGAAFYRGLARRNFDIPQIKLGVDAKNGVFASFEVPSRILDREELLEDVFTLAGVMDEVRRGLLLDALPADDAAPERPAPRPPTAAAIIEARR